MDSTFGAEYLEAVETPIFGGVTKLASELGSQASCNKQCGAGGGEEFCAMSGGREYCTCMCW